MKTLSLALALVTVAACGQQKAQDNNASVAHTNDGQTAFTCTFSDSRGAGASITLVGGFEDASRLVVLRQGIVVEDVKVKAASKGRITSHDSIPYAFHFSNGKGIKLLVSPTLGLSFEMNGRASQCDWGFYNEKLLDRAVSSTAYPAEKTLVRCVSEDLPEGGPIFKTSVVTNAQGDVVRLKNSPSEHHEDNVNADVLAIQKGQASGRYAESTYLVLNGRTTPVAGEDNVQPGDFTELAILVPDERASAEKRVVAVATIDGEKKIFKHCSLGSGYALIRK